MPEIVPETFQVFINHREPDVKKTLASLIYHRLINCGLSVFLDRDEIRTGDTISFAISTAIQSASLHIAIFSETYAESKWCLDELLCILRSHHKRNTKVIPVFFDVEPTDLRHIENGRYAKAFENHQHKGRFTIEDIQIYSIEINS